MKRDVIDPRILRYLKRRLKEKVSEHTIQSAISRTRGKDPSLTLNAAAEVYAKRFGESVQKFFNPQDRECFKSTKIEKVPIKTSKPRGKRAIIEIAKYDTIDELLKAHLDEINKTYTCGCFTATFILCRKVLENLIIHHVLKKKYPTTQQDREKYWDFKRNRFLDFGVLLTNLKHSANDFKSEKKLVERVCQLAEGFKDEANDMTHSLYHLATKKEIDAKNFQQILNLVAILEKSLNP
jgi:hypothetical protein